ncbi:MAG: NYN domain-containing protein [Candidatus Hinthialibacter antarcticus]|nr:NYN domain-containing protein [Candidatus Hinthialibacter antarcticus]
MISELFNNIKIGVYVDVANISRNGGYGIQFDVLRNFACRDNSIPVRLNAYVAYDRTRADTDYPYRKSQQNFFSALQDFGYKVIRKEVKWYTDEQGNRYGKANADLDLAVDALLQSKNLDRVLLVTGDGDFVRVVKALQNNGCRVEVLAFDNISTELRNEADIYFSGFLIPGLLPFEDAGVSRWGQLGSRVRGVCYSVKENYGWFRFVKEIHPDMNRKEGYTTVFFHESKLPNEVSLNDLPSRHFIFEFTIETGNKEGSYQASDIRLISPSRS